MRDLMRSNLSFLRDLSIDLRISRFRVFLKSQCCPQHFPKEIWIIRRELLWWITKPCSSRTLWKQFRRSETLHRCRKNQKKTKKRRQNLERKKRKGLMLIEGNLKEMRMEKLLLLMVQRKKKIWNLRNRKRNL